MRTEDENAALSALGNNIRAERARRNLTQQAVADASKLHIAHYGRIERGAHNASLLVLMKIARAIGVDLTVLVQGVVEASLPAQKPSNESDG